MSESRLLKTHPWFDMVREFHVAMKQPVGDVNDPKPSRPDLRVRLIREEYQETLEARDRGDMIGVVDGLADLLYVAIGTAVEWGVPLDFTVSSADGVGPVEFVAFEAGELFDNRGLEFIGSIAMGEMPTGDSWVDEAIHPILEVAEMCLGVYMDPVFREVHRSNMGKVGGPVREDGKVLKPDGWTPPDIDGVLRAQGWQA